MSKHRGLEVKSSVFGLLTLITQNVSQVDEGQIDKCIDMVMAHRDSQILVIGAGRSGLVGRAFALRLLHLGYKVHVLGDTIVPSIMANDLVIAISGSGTTKLVTAAVEAAKKIEARVIALTSFKDSPLALLADHVVQVKGRIISKEEGRQDYFARQILGLHEPLAPLGTLFEDSCMILVDAMISVLMDEMQLSEEHLAKLHANIE
ncbi:MAG: SIS domain-containing protein [Thaumarchaeota archaeon]|nr:SIS domain-containing protein [Nitrososphaerota archaeon]